MQTGDLVLFRGVGIGSALIAAFTGRFSHVGMVYAQEGRVYLWESVSHSDHMRDEFTGRYESGVRLVDLKRRLATSDSPFFGVVRLGGDGDRNELNARFTDFYRREMWTRRPYETSTFHLVRAGLDCVLGHNAAHDRSNYFCSKLVTETYIHMGLLPGDVNSGRTVPLDFWNARLNLQDEFARDRADLPRSTAILINPTFDCKSSQSNFRLQVKSTQLSIASQVNPTFDCKSSQSNFRLQVKSTQLSIASQVNPTFDCKSSQSNFRLQVKSTQLSIASQVNPTFDCKSSQSNFRLQVKSTQLSIASQVNPTRTVGACEKF